MSNDFTTLSITSREVEKLSGKEISESFVGGVLGGVYRPSWLKTFSGYLALATIELIVGGLAFVFSLPIGLSLLRQSNSGGLRVFLLSFCITIGVMIGWNIYMRLQLRQLKRLMLLLDEIDHFNAIVETITVLDQLEKGSVEDEQALFTALELTRENLIAALVTEKLLRENQRLLDRQSAFLSHLETNLITLKTLEMNQQAQDYRHVLNEALTINLAVQREMATLRD